MVDRTAYVANQVFEFELVHRNNLDLRTRLAGLQGLLNLLEQISVSEKKRSFFRGQLNLDRLALHQANFLHCRLGDALPGSLTLLDMTPRLKWR